MNGKRLQQTGRNGIVTRANRVLNVLDRCATEWARRVDAVLGVPEEPSVAYSYSHNHSGADFGRSCSIQKETL